MQGDNGMNYSRKQVGDLFHISLTIFVKPENMLPILYFHIGLLDG